MDTETLNVACFIIMVVITCCIIKLLHVVRASTEPTRTIHDQSVLGTAREPTPGRSGVVERTEQHGNTTPVTARRQHPQEHDERFS